MTFSGIGYPDAQDASSFTSGRVLDTITLDDVPGGELVETLIDGAELTNVTSLFLDPTGQFLVEAIPLLPSGGELSQASASWLFPTGSQTTFLVGCLGGDLLIRAYNLAATPGDLLITPSTLFKASVDRYTSRYRDAWTAALVAPAMGQAATGADPNVGLYDHAAVAAVADGAGTLTAVHWFPYFDGAYKLGEAHELLGTLSASADLTAEFPIRSGAVSFLVDSAEVMDDLTVTLTAHYSRTS